MEKYMHSGDPLAADPGCGERILAQLVLMPKSLVESVSGASTRGQELLESPGELTVMVGSSAALGAGLTRLARSGSFGRMASNSIPYCLGLAAAADLTYRVGIPMHDAIRGTWNNPHAVDHHARELGTQLGSTVVDYGLMGSSGYAGVRTATLFRSNRANRTAIGKNLDELTSLLQTELARSPELRSARFDAGVESQLRAYKDGKYNQTEPLGKELDATMSRMQSALNQFTRSHELPDIAINWRVLGRETRAEAAMGQADVAIDAMMLAKSRSSRIVEYVGHEVTHVDQETVMIRRLADKMGIGEKATPEQLLALKNQFGSCIADENVSQALVADVVRIRNGRHLEPVQAKRADEMIAGEGLRQTVYTNMENSIQRAMSIDSACTEVCRSGLSTASRLKTEKGRMDLLGRNELSPELEAAVDKLLTQSALARQPVYDPARKVVYDELRKELMAAVKMQKQSIRGYYELPTEAEAFSAGNHAAWHYFVRGNLSTKLLLGTGTAALNEPVVLLADAVQDHKKR